MSKLSHSEKASTLYGKNLLSERANSFLTELTLFRKGLASIKANWNSQFSPLAEMVKNLTRVSSPLYVKQNNTNEFATLIYIITNRTI